MQSNPGGLEILYRQQHAGEVKIILTPPASSVSTEGDACQIAAAPNIELKNTWMKGGQCLAKKKSSGYDTGIPLHETGALARVLRPEMQKFLKARRDGGSSRSGKSSGKRMTATGIRTFFGIVLNGIFTALTVFKPLVAAQDAGQLF